MHHTVLNGLLSAMNAYKLSSRHSDLSCIWPCKSLHEELQWRQSQSLPLSCMTSVAELKALSGGSMGVKVPAKLPFPVNIQQLKSVFSCLQLEEKPDSKASPQQGLLLLSQEEQQERAANTKVLLCASTDLYIRSLQAVELHQIQSKIDGESGNGQQFMHNSTYGSDRRCHQHSGEGCIVTPQLVIEQSASFTAAEPQMLVK